jgi:hypothetical protein
MLTLALTAPAQAGVQVEPFALADHTGNVHALADHAGAPALVIMVHGNGCPIVRNALPSLAALRDQYAARGVAFLLLNANLQDNRAAVAAEVASFSIDFPVLLDDTQLVAESLALERTGEVLLVDPRTSTLVYRGPIDDRLDYERQRPEASAHYLRDAIDALLAGQPVAVPERRAVGCLINLPEQRRRAEHAAISYANTIAPLLQAKCVGCHQDGAAGWAMHGHDAVRGYSLAMRRLLRTWRRPGRPDDPHAAAFAGDGGLGVADTQTLVHWIEAGAPRGDGDDPLAAGAAAPAASPVSVVSRQGP